MKEVPFDELKKWAGGEIHLLSRQEEAAKKYKEAHYVFFECAYCPARYDSLKELRKHTVGRKRSSEDRYMYVDCEERCRVDGVLNKYRCPATFMPTRFPWGSLVCTEKDRLKPRVDEATGNTIIDFEVPENIKLEWERGMVDERKPIRRGRPSRN